MLICMKGYNVLFFSSDVLTSEDVEKKRTLPFHQLHKSTEKMNVSAHLRIIIIVCVHRRISSSQNSCC